MATITFRGESLTLHDDETVLDCLERHGYQRPASCRSGVCQSCMMRVKSGEPPDTSQAGLKSAWQEQSYFLPCVCTPAGDLEVEECGTAETYKGRVVAVAPMTTDVVRVDLSVAEGFTFVAGQFVSLVRPADNLTRPYSIASTPANDNLELHVAVLPNGQMSNWLKAAEGEPVEVRGPSGECFYHDADPTMPMLLAGTGTGLAPLLGVVRAALEAGHRGPMHLYHGATAASRLYLYDDLLRMASQHEQLHFVPSTLDDDVDLRDVRQAPIDQVISMDFPKLDGYRVYLCGNPALVQMLKRQVFLAGASLDHIHSDPFVTASA